MEKSKQRSSNLEVFRLVAMLFITLHHFLVHGLENAGYKINHTDLYAVFLNSFLVVGVNCFILISGYFGIKPKLKGYVNLLLTCLIVSIGFFVYQGIKTNSFTWQNFNSNVFVLSQSPYWFIRHYVYLYLLSPLLNAATTQLKRTDFIKLLFILSIFIYYFGWYAQGNINKNGYNVFNFIYLYVIGQFIKLHGKTVYNKAKKYLFTYIILSAILFCWAYFYIDTVVISKYIFTYNNPLVILSSISLFLYFKNIKISSSFINYVAQSTLIIYLIQDHPLVRKPILKHYLVELSNRAEGVAIVPYLLVIAFLFMIACVGIDQIRIYLIKLVEIILNKIGFYKMEEHFNYLMKKV